jgi:hypothetical protein
MEKQPPFEGHEWDAQLIEGRWRVGMKGNLDTPHDAILSIHPGIINEALAERIARDIVELQNTRLKNVGWVHVAQCDFYHFKDGRQVLGKLDDGEVMILYWEDKTDYKDTCDTVTYKAGWSNGERCMDGGRNTHGRLLVFEPTFVRAIPE